MLWPLAGTRLQGLKESEWTFSLTWVLSATSLHTKFQNTQRQDDDWVKRKTHITPWTPHQDARYNKSHITPWTPHQDARYNRSHITPWTPHQDARYNKSHITPWTPHQDASYNGSHITPWTPHQDASYNRSHITTWTPHQDAIYNKSHICIQERKIQCPIFRNRNGLQSNPRCWSVSEAWTHWQT